MATNHQFRLRCWLLLLAWPLPVWAQSPTGAPLPPPIPAPRIAERYTQTSAILRTASKLSDVDAVLSDIRRDLPGVTIGVQDLAAFTRSTLTQPSLRDDADSLRTNWRRITSQLELWSTRLRSLADQLDSDSFRFSQEAALWSSTLQSADAANLPDPVRQLVASTSAAIQAAGKPTADRRAEVIVLQSEIAEQINRARASLDEITQVEELQQRELFSFDSSPIWRIREETAARSAVKVASGHPDSFEFSTQSPQLRRATTLQTRVYLAIYITSILAAWLLLRVLRSRSARSWETSTVPGLQALVLALRRPVSSAVFLATAFNAVLITEPESWMVVIAGLALLVPSLRLLPGLIANSLRNVVYVLIVVFVSAQLLTLIPTSSIWHRPAWLILQSITSLLLAWLLRALKVRSQSGGKWVTFLRVLTFVGLWASVASVVCNVFGIFQLSVWLVQSILISYYTIGIVRGIVVLLLGLIAAGLRTEYVNQVPALATRSAWIEERAMHSVRIVAAVSFLGVMIYAIGLWIPFQARLNSALDASFAVGVISISLRRLLAFALAIMLAFFVSGLLRVLMEVTVYPRTHKPAGERVAFSKIIHYGVLVVGFLFAFAAAGVQLSNIAILAGGLSVGIGLGLQHLVNNFVSGLILLFERPLQVGNLISIGSTTGFVRNIGMRASVIRTFDGAEVTVPNGDLLSGGVINWSRDDARRRSEIRVSTGYEANAAEVIRILKTEAQQHRSVAQDAEITAALESFGENTQDFVLRFWSEKPVAIEAASEIRVQIVEALRAAGISLERPPLGTVVVERGP